MMGYAYNYAGGGGGRHPVLTEFGVKVLRRPRRREDKIRAHLRKIGY
jgi:hypothetical protein